jgi:lycopene cyclase domain-containing protein
LSQKFLYLSLNLLTILFPLLFSFYPKAKFSRKWKYLWPAILIPGIAFVVSDEAFTRMGVWGFNPAYLSGFYVGSLPLEEILFFICIPYACVFVYEAVNVLCPRDLLGPHQRAISITLIVVCLFVAVTNTSKLYTVTTFLVLALCLVWLQLIRKQRFMGRFYAAYLIILIPFFIVNGILTGSGTEEPVVWYNDAETLGVRIATIPVEDIFYCMLLMLLNVSAFEWFQMKAKKEALPSAPLTNPNPNL